MDASVQRMGLHCAEMAQLLQWREEHETRSAGAGASAANAH